MSDQDLISLDALSDVLRRHLGQRDTGTLFIKTPENHWGYFGLRDGFIVSAMCRGVKGAKAMQHFQNAESVSVRFDSSQVTGESGRGPQLTNDQIFAGLAGLPMNAPSFGPSHSTALPAAVARASAPNAVVVQRIADLIKSEAAEALGPIGPMICDDLIAERRMRAEDIQHVLGQLAPSKCVCWNASGPASGKVSVLLRKPRQHCQNNYTFLGNQRWQTINGRSSRAYAAS